MRCISVALKSERRGEEGRGRGREQSDAPFAEGEGQFVTADQGLGHGPKRIGAGRRAGRGEGGAKGVTGAVAEGWREKSSQLKSAEGGEKEGEKGRLANKCQPTRKRTMIQTIIQRDSCRVSENRD